MASSFDWSAADVDRVVDRVFDGGFPLPAGREDRLPIDPLLREIRAADKALAQRIGNSVARYVQKGTVEQHGWALMFYQSNLVAPGGEAVAEHARSGGDGYADSTLNTIPGLVGGTMREALLYVAMLWDSGSAVDDALMALVHEDILSGDGGCLLSGAAKHTPDWFAKKEATLVALYPKETGPIFKARVQRGEDPETAFDALVKHADAAGRESLEATIGYSRRWLDAGTRDALLARL